MFFSPVGSGLDPDAEAFLTAAGISDSTITNAINTLVIDLKGYGIWSKLIAIYPFVGGTSFTHKFNLKNPLDTDAAYRLVYTGTPGHSSNGLSCVNGYADTKIVPNVDMVFNNTSLTVYSRTDIDGIYYDWYSEGCIQFFSRLSNLFLVDAYSFSGDARVLDSQTTSIGFFQFSRTLATDIAIYYNGILKTTTSNSDGSLTSPPLMLGYGLGASNIGESTREYAFASVGTGLNSTENSDLYTIVQAFQTTLSRQV